MIKKIICNIEDVKNFQKFHYEGDVYIKLPLLEHEIKIEPVPWDLRSIVEYKTNCYKLGKSEVYSYVETGSEVVIYPLESEDAE